MTARRDEVVLIGPVCAGKTTTARALARKLGVFHVEMDAVANAYFVECPDFDGEVFARLGRQPGGFLAQVRYWGPAGVYAVERVLAEHHDCVFDLGAGHTWYLQPDLRARIATALKPFVHVVLLLPENDRVESVRILRDRCMRDRGEDWIHDGVDFIEQWVCDGQNDRLATIRQLTSDIGPEEIAESILAQLS